MLLGSGEFIGLNVLDNDLELGGSNLDESTLVVLTQPTLDIDLIFEVHNDHIHYFSDFGVAGVDSFTYRICNDDGFCDEATVTIYVGPVLPPGNCPSDPGCPDAQDDAYIFFGGEERQLKILDNDLEQSGAPLDESTIEIFLYPEHDIDADFWVHGDHVHYRAQTGYDGVDSFTYRICNEDFQCEVATVTIYIGAVMPPGNCPSDPGCPSAEDDAYTFVRGQEQQLKILDNDLEQSGSPLDESTLEIFSYPMHDVNPAFGIHGDHIHYRARNGSYTGADSFTYRVCNEDLLCDLATVTISIIP